MESDKISVAAPGEYDSIEAALNGAKALPNEAGGYWKRKGGGEKDVYLSSGLASQKCFNQHIKKCYLPGNIVSTRPTKIAMVQAEPRTDVTVVGHWA